eukprot:TCONS_00052913-protein
MKDVSYACTEPEEREELLNHKTMATSPVKNNTETTSDLEGRNDLEKSPSESLTIEIPIEVQNNNNDVKTPNEELAPNDIDPNMQPSTSRDCIVDIKRTNSVEANLESKYCFETVSLCEPCCRVCQCNGDEEILISPCLCSGSVKWIHESCLIQWMKSSLKDSCELCTKKIKITKRKKPFTKWKLPSQRPTPVLWVLVFVTAIALNLASVVKDASKHCATTPCLVFYAVGIIGVILGTLFLMYWSKRAKVFISHWVELNEEWVIVVDNEDQKLKTGSEWSANCDLRKGPDGKSNSCSVTINT